MIKADYPVGALALLLQKDCVSERYYPLIPYVDALICGLRRLGCRVKSDAEKLTDDAYSGILPDAGTVRLFRRFLTIYDPKPQKFRELDTVCTTAEERAVYEELYCLPGVRQVRAYLYYRSGYRSLADFAKAAAEDVTEDTARTVASLGLACTVPLPKEVRTHIAVARAFTAE